MNANINKTHYFLHKMKYDLKGHGRSHKVILAKLFLAQSFINQFLIAYLKLSDHYNLDFRSYGKLLSLFFFLYP